MSAAGDSQTDAGPAGTSPIGRFGAWGLVGQLGPEKSDELAGDRDGGHGGAFAVLGEVPVAVMEPDLGLPGPW